MKHGRHSVRGWGTARPGFNPSLLPPALHGYTVDSLRAGRGLALGTLLNAPPSASHLRCHCLAWGRWLGQVARGGNSFCLSRLPVTDPPDPFSGWHRPCRGARTPWPIPVPHGSLTMQPSQVLAPGNPAGDAHAGSPLATSTQRNPALPVPPPHPGCEGPEEGPRGRPRSPAGARGRVGGYGRTMARPVSRGNPSLQLHLARSGPRARSEAEGEETLSLSLPGWAQGSRLRLPGSPPACHLPRRAWQCRAPSRERPSVPPQRRELLVALR